jgi:hypothetical protein
MLKQSLKKLVTPAIKAAVSRRVRFGSDPYGGAAPAEISGGASDFFLARGGDYETRFIAENTLAIINGRHLACRHVFNMLDPSGRSIGRREVVDDSYNTVVRFTDADIDGAFCGFIHQVFYDELDSSVVQPKIFHQHRGYTGFRLRSHPDAVFANVHGNFGGLFENARGDIEGFAVPRAQHCYSTQFSYSSGFRYELFYLNPTKSRLRIELFTVGDDQQTRELTSVVLSPLGAARVEYDGADQQIFWRSALAVCRPIIFEYPVAGQSFDVFHG